MRKYGNYLPLRFYVKLVLAKFSKLTFWQFCRALFLILTNFSLKILDKVTKNQISELQLAEYSSFNVTKTSKLISRKNWVAEKFSNFRIAQNTVWKLLKFTITFGKLFVKTTFLPKKSLMSWFDGIFFSVRVFAIFPHKITTVTELKKFSTMWFYVKTKHVKKHVQKSSIFTMCTIITFDLFNYHFI